MSRYGWIITKDHIASPDAKPETNCNAIGMIGPYNCTFSPDEIKEGEKFEMYDDDMVLYYEGFIVGKHHGFEPLDDFGTPNAGAVHIKYDGEFL